MNDNYKNLELAFRLCGYNLTPELIALAWELTKLIQKKGDLATIKDIAEIEVSISKIDMVTIVNRTGITAPEDEPKSETA